MTCRHTATPMGVLSVGISSGTAVDEQEEFTAIRIAIVSSKLLAIRSWGNSGWMTTRSESTEPWPSRSSEQIRPFQAKSLRQPTGPRGHWNP